MKAHSIPVVFDVVASSYDEAVKAVKNWVQDQHNEEFPIGTVDVWEPSFEHDNEGQRVFYLDPEESNGYVDEEDSDG